MEKSQDNSYLKVIEQITHVLVKLIIYFLINSEWVKLIMGQKIRAKIFAFRKKVNK